MDGIRAKPSSISTTLMLMNNVAKAESQIFNDFFFLICLNGLICLTYTSGINRLHRRGHNNQVSIYIASSPVIDPEIGMWALFWRLGPGRYWQYGGSCSVAFLEPETQANVVEVEKTVETHTAIANCSCYCEVRANLTLGSMASSQSKAVAWIE